LFYVALDLKEVIGFLVVDFKDSQLAEILWIGVKPEHQDQGYGTELITHVNEELRSKGIKVIKVKTLSEHEEYAPYEKTRNFYKKNGFILLEVMDPYPNWGPGNSCAIYIKVL
jgi:ribosomal protein S18 acetylase RimI-like enzyme